MPSPRRILRLQQLVKEVAAETVQRRLADPRIGFVTVTRVKLSPDLSEATVFWSTLGTETQRRTTARALADATPVVQGVVAKALATRTTPRIAFRFDAAIEKAARLEDLFARLRAERGEPAPGAEGAAPPAGEADAGEAGEEEGEEDAEEETDDEVEEAGGDAAPPAEPPPPPAPAEDAPKSGEAPRRRRPRRKG